MSQPDKRVARALMGIYLRGIAMGAADLVPGVSGGTVAFITGIYQRLLNAIGAVSRGVLPLALRGRFAEAWRALDGTFLLVLFGGILTSIGALSRLVGYLLESHPIVIWSFFCGLVLASSLHLMRQVNGWSASVVGTLVIGAVLALLISLVKPVSIEPTLPIIFGAGAIAICAMILPGISGSFILVIMGLYAPILAAVRELEVALLLTFAGGCAVGLLSFARLLSWLLARAYRHVMALLTGFLVGSLYMLWPWKETTAWYTAPSGEALPLAQRNILPHIYEALTGDPHTAMAFVAASVGFLLVWALERQSRTVEVERAQG